MPRPFRLTAPEPPERELQENVIRTLDHLVLPPAYVFSAAIGATKLSPQQAAALTRAGVRRGLPDIFLLHGALYGIELKRRTGRLSRTKVVRTRRGAPRILDGQIDVFPRLLAAGVCDIAVCRTVDEVLAQLEAWQIPLRIRPTAGGN